MAEPEFKKSERIGHESIIKIEDGLTLSPYYAVSYNISETGMHFKSLFEMYPGANILVKIDDYALSENQVSAKVVWCKKLEKCKLVSLWRWCAILPVGKDFCLKAPFQFAPQMTTPDMKKGGIVIQNREGLVMASNFEVSVDKKSKGFGLKLVGDFDATSAYELIYAIKKLPEDAVKISIYTNGLKTIHPFGLDVFHRNMGPRNGQSNKIVFTGNHASQLSMENSKRTS